MKKALSIVVLVTLLAAAATLAGRSTVAAAVSAVITPAGTSGECLPGDEQYNEGCGAGPHCTIDFLHLTAAGAVEVASDPSGLSAEHAGEFVKIRFSDCHAIKAITYQFVVFRDGVEFGRSGPFHQSVPASPNAIGVAPSPEWVGQRVSIRLVINNETSWQIVDADFGVVMAGPGP